jgi:formate-dependent phosphoribosylglycinamide formyltransferase (GAR transformylase)
MYCPLRIEFPGTVYHVTARGDRRVRNGGKRQELTQDRESFVKRRMGMALVHEADVEQARRQTKPAASRVRPRRG